MAGRARKPSRACAHALAQYEVVGVSTNVEFLGRLMSAPSFVEARLDTALIERERAHLFAARAPAPRVAWDLAVLALTWQRAPPAIEDSPWQQTRRMAPRRAGAAALEIPLRRFRGRSSSVLS